MATSEEADDPLDAIEDNVDIPLNTSIPLVLDNGGGILKAGLSSTERPFQVQSLVGTPKHRRVMLSAPRSEKLFGDEAYKQRGLCRLSYPQRGGLVRDWNDQIQLWQYLYRDVMELEEGAHPLLMTEVAGNPLSNRVRIAQIHLEYFQSPSICFVPPSVLALYSMGRLSGCVVASGHGVSSCVPMLDGFAVPHSVSRLDVGGHDITKYFAQILTKCGDYHFRTSSELQTVRIIKEKECALSEKAVDGMANPHYHSTGLMSTAASRGNNMLSSLQGLGPSFAGLGISRSGRGGGGDDNSPRFELPDGSIVNIGNTHQRAAEILFDPTLIGHSESGGIQHLVVDSIRKCDAESRNRLYDSIYLCGGNANIKNFEKRLLSELKLRVKSNHNRQRIKIRNGRAKDKALMPFIGGVLAASNPVFGEMFVSKAEFEEKGARALFEKRMC